MAVDPNKIDSVLIAGEWQDVKPGTFEIESLDFHLPGAQLPAYRAGIGFTFEGTDGALVTGPILAVQAFKIGGTATVAKRGPGRPAGSTNKAVTK